MRFRYLFLVGLLQATPALQAPQDSAAPESDLMRLDVQRVFGASERLQPVTEGAGIRHDRDGGEIARYGYRALGGILRSVRSSTCRTIAITATSAFADSPGRATTTRGS